MTSNELYKQIMDLVTAHPELVKEYRVSGYCALQERSLYITIDTKDQIKETPSCSPSSK